MNDIESIVEIPEMSLLSTSSLRSLLVAARDADVNMLGDGGRQPARNSFPAGPVEVFACSCGGISPISSRKGAGIGKFETAFAHGHRIGEGAFSWLNSSLSSRCSDRAAQLTEMKGALDGAEVVNSSATSSLPVPDSPVINTPMRG